MVNNANLWVVSFVSNPRSLGEHKKKSCTLELSATDTPPIDNQLMDMDDTQLPTDDNYEAVMEINLVIEKQPGEKHEAFILLNVSLIPLEISLVLLNS